MYDEYVVVLLVLEPELFFAITITITATNNGQGLTLEFSDDPTDPEFYERINNNPCN